MDSSSDPEFDIRTQGAVYQPIHGIREVNIFPIQEHELKTIGICNSQVSLWCSIGSACLALMAACGWDMATSDAAASRNCWPFIIACGIVAAFSFGTARYYWTEKNGEIERIKAETR